MASSPDIRMDAVAVTLWEGNLFILREMSAVAYLRGAWSRWATTRITLDPTCEIDQFTGWRENRPVRRQIVTVGGSCNTRHKYLSPANGEGVGVGKAGAIQLPTRSS